MVLSNFFDHSPSSKKFIVRSFIYSVVLIITTFLSVFLANNLSINEYTIFNIYYYPFYSIFSIVLLIIFVILIDYISFWQTFIFLNIARNAKLSLSMGWVALANIVLSVNIFSFLFPVALVGLGLVMMRMPEIVDLQAGWMKIDSSIPIINKETIASSPELNDPYIKENESIILSQTEEKSMIGIYMQGSQKIASEYNVSSAFIAITNFQPAALDIQVNRGLQRLIRESQDGYEVTSSEKNNSAIYIPGVFVSNLKSLVNFYSIGFTLSSSVRVGFGEIISLNPGQVSVNEMASVYNFDHAGISPKRRIALFFKWRIPLHYVDSKETYIRFRKLQPVVVYSWRHREARETNLC